MTAVYPADDVLALIHAAKLPGFGRMDEDGGYLGSPGFTLEAHARLRRNPESHASGHDVLALVRAAGLARFGRLGAISIKALSPALAPQAIVAAANVATQAVHVSTPPPAPSSQISTSEASVSRRQLLVLDVAPGGEAALAALEAKMEMPFAANYRGEPYWSAASTPDGGTQRAFTFMRDQQLGFRDLLGNLGCPALKLSISGVDLSKFKAMGTAVPVYRGPPQLPLGLPSALRKALS